LRTIWFIAEATAGAPTDQVFAGFTRGSAVSIGGRAQGSSEFTGSC
jgi:hypothetical protein